MVFCLPENAAGELRITKTDTCAHTHRLHRPAQSGVLRYHRNLYAHRYMHTCIHTYTYTGVTDQPSVVFSFPPPSTSSYTWPQETERRVAWASFNMNPETTFTLKLLKGQGEEIAEVKKDNVKNDAREKVEIPSSVSAGPGYYLSLCDSSSGECWLSGKFDIKPKIENQEEPVKYELLVPGNPDILIPGSDAYGIFVAGIVLSASGSLGIESHRIEVTELRGVQVSGRRQEATGATGVKVMMNILADDTGRDTSPNTDILLRGAGYSEAQIESIKTQAPSTYSDIEDITDAQELSEDSDIVDLVGEPEIGTCACAEACTHTCAHVCVCVYACVCERVCVCVCVYYPQGKHTHTHTHTHTHRYSVGNRG